MEQATKFLFPGSHQGVLSTEKNRPASEEEQGRYHACGVAALKTGHVATAYQCFSQIEQDCPAVLFNLALCYFQTEEYEKALDLLQNARRKLKMLAIQQPCRPAPMAFERLEAQEGDYLYPMQEELILLFPNRADYRMMQLQADILYALNRRQELQGILSALAGKGYKNIEYIQRELVSK